MSWLPCVLHLVVLPGQRPITLHLHELAAVVLGMGLLALASALREGRRVRTGA
ncbi:hypothetical protein [Delftia tsuruhatensis]|uniref:hypothetical protein n=1 Tax=Delftia tsuruhatensis TaxID=180282 RepID=UPI001F441A73|nr:hypothetical protein [Delftia tsuruhatensis]